ncbi:hypothetical protein KJ693_11345 [bacterium]|nr:hypothetical protein [bacterium]MBU1615885.1 hypothetical protein [bacterium]
MSRALLTLRDYGGLPNLIENEVGKWRYHRIEVEHALHLANLKQEEIKQVLVNGFKANLSTLKGHCPISVKNNYEKW